MHVGAQVRVAVEIVLLCDALAVRKDLRTLRVLFGRDVAEFLQQRDVHIALDIAGDPRIPIPIPGAAYVGRPVDQPPTFHAELTQPHRRQQPTEAGTHDRNVHLVGAGFADEFPVDPRAFGETGELTRGYNIP